VNSIVFFRRSALKGIILQSRSAFVHAELFIKLARNGARMIETEVLHKEREFEFGAGGNWRVMCKTLVDLLKFSIAEKETEKSIT
jgi:hypothetical protein